MTKRIALAVELAVVLALRYGIRALFGIAAVKAAVPGLPILERVWLTFLIFVVGLILWLRARGEPLSGFGIKPYRPWIRLTLIGIGAAVAAVVVSTATDPFVDKFFGKAVTTHFADVKGNLPLFLYLLPCVWIFAAFGEEFFYRGYVMTRLSAIAGGGRGAWGTALIGQAVLFGLGHAYQGPGGMIGTGLYGLVYGGAFLVSGRSLWPGALAHGLLDTLGFTLLYLGAM